MGFYEDMRDDVAGKLIRQYGLDATLRQETTVYDPTTGEATVTSNDVAIKVVKQPIERPALRNFWRQELIDRASYQFLVSAQETASAAVVPTANDKVVLQGRVYAVIGVNEVAPGEVVVVYKILVEG